MRTDPEPNKPLRRVISQDPEVQTYACRPQAPGLLQLQRRMPRIALKQIEIFIGQRLDLFGKAIVMLPKRFARQVLHSGRISPRFNSSSISAKTASNFPLSASLEICLSHASERKWSNQAEKRDNCSWPNLATSCLICSTLTEGRIARGCRYRKREVSLSGQRQIPSPDPWNVKCQDVTPPALL